MRQGVGHPALARRSQEIARKWPTDSPDSVVDNCGRQPSQMKHHVPTAFFHEASWVSVRRRASMGLLDPLPTLARLPKVNRFSETKRTES